MTNLANLKLNEKRTGKYKIITAILIVLMIAAISTACGSSDQQATGGTDSTTAGPLDPNGEIFADGTYIVGKDLQSGLYRVALTDTLTKVGYVERAKDANMELSSILANVSYSGNGYIKILDTDAAIKIKGVEIQPINIEDIVPAIQTEVKGGMYLIGYDLAPGTYDVAITDMATNSGIIQRLSGVSVNPEEILSNDIISKSGTIKIEEGDFAVLIQGVKITLQK